MKTLDLSKMTKTEARIAIAKDVLARMRYRKVSSGQYLSGRDLNNVVSRLTNNPYTCNLNAQFFVDLMEKDCQVCALGNMFISHVRAFNKVNIRDINPTKKGVTAPLLQYFDDDQLDLIEAAFEGVLISPISDLDDSVPRVKRANKYMEKYPSPSKRLRAIMINIIKNNGVFRP